MNTHQQLKNKASEKYQEAFAKLKKEIARNSLECSKFTHVNNLPGNFVRACEGLGLIKRIAKGKYVVKHDGEVSLIIGKTISLEISRMETIRLQHFKTTNK